MTTGAGGAVSVRQRAWEGLTEPEYQRIRRIWEESFPPEERFADDSVASRESTWLWTVSSSEAGLIGFATAFLLPRSGAAYLEYLAVDSAKRCGGAGSAALTSIADDLSTAGSVSGIVLEVEDPERTADPAPDMFRRLDFYRRWGAFPLSLIDGYRMPDLATPGETLPMLLLWRGLREAGEPGAEEVELVLNDLYRGYYAGVAPEGHLADLLSRVSRFGG